LIDVCIFIVERELRREREEREVGTAKVLHFYSHIVSNFVADFLWAKVVWKCEGAMLSDRTQMSGVQAQMMIVGFEVGMFVI